MPTLIVAPYASTNGPHLEVSRRMAGGRFDFSAASDSEIQALIDRATSGDAGRAATLIDGIAPLLRERVARALSRRRGQSAGRVLRPDIEDLVQETLAGIFARGGRTLRSWDPARGLGFLSFIGLVAEREVGMRMRARKRNPWTEEPTATDVLMYLGGVTGDLARQIESRDLLRRIAGRVRERLTPQGSRYFQWLFLEGRSVQTVANETGASADALYAWRSRLAKLVREVHAELDTAQTALPLRRPRPASCAATGCRTRRVPGWIESCQRMRLARIPLSRADSGEARPDLRGRG